MKFTWTFLLALVGLVQGFSLDRLSIEGRLERLEEKQGYARQKGKFQAITGGELLYWKANLDGVAYETTSLVVSSPGGTTANTHFKTRTPHFSYDAGFRVCLGVQSAYDLFDICLIWTRFYTKGHDAAHGTLVNGVAIPKEKTLSSGIGLIQSLDSIPNKAMAECNVRENILDLQLGRGIIVSQHFFMRPYFGIKAVWSDIHWDISLDRTFLVPSAFDQDFTRLKIENDFNAVGGLIGMELEWKMPHGLGITVRGAGALVYGLSEEKTRQLYTFLPANTTSSLEQKFHAKNSTHCVKGLAEIFAGLFWDSDGNKIDMSKRKIGPAHLRLYVGYEFLEWPFFAQKTNQQSNRERERFSLGFQGFTAGAKLFF